MPRTFIEQLTRPGQMVEDVYQVVQKDLRTTKKGTFFISGRLRDRTGELPAIMWDASEALFGAIPQDGFALVKGRVGEFNDALQIVIEAMRPAKPAEVRHADFLPVGPNDPEKDFAKLRKVLDQIKRPPCGPCSTPCGKTPTSSSASSAPPPPKSTTTPTWAASWNTR